MVADSSIIPKGAFNTVNTIKKSLFINVADTLLYSPIHHRVLAHD